MILQRPCSLHDVGADITPHNDPLAAIIDAIGRSDDPAKGPVALHARIAGHLAGGGVDQGRGLTKLYPWPSVSRTLPVRSSLRWSSR